MKDATVNFVMRHENVEENFALGELGEISCSTSFQKPGNPTKEDPNPKKQISVLTGIRYVKMRLFSALNMALVSMFVSEVAGLLLAGGDQEGKFGSEGQSQEEKTNQDQDKSQTPGTDPSKLERKTSFIDMVSPSDRDR